MLAGLVTCECQEIIFPFPLPVSRDCRHSFIHGCITPMYAFIVTLPSFPCPWPTVSSDKNTCDYTGPIWIIHDNLPISVLSFIISAMSRFWGLVCRHLWSPIIQPALLIELENKVCIWNGGKYAGKINWDQLAVLRIHTLWHPLLFPLRDWFIQCGLKQDKLYWGETGSMEASKNISPVEN